MRSFVFRATILSIFACFLGAIQPSSAQQAPGPNSDPTYQQLRNITLSEEKVSIKGLKDKPRRALLNYMDDVLSTN